MSETAAVTAVVVHYRTAAETVRAAHAVAQTAPEAEILVVDNASGDRIGERLAANIPAARVITESRNRGYGAACNRGARESSRAYLLFLNSDAYVERGAVAALISALEGDAQAAVVGPRLLHPDGKIQPSIQRLPTPWRIFCESSGLAALSGGRGFLRGHTKTREDHERPSSVTALKGAALLVRRCCFEEVGGFDEGFFLYAEEADLMTRLRQRGYRILYEPRASVVHVGGASAGDAFFGHLQDALRRYVEKFHGPAAARFAAAVMTLGSAARYAMALLTPGKSGRRRRARYRAALAGRPDPR